MTNQVSREPDHDCCGPASSEVPSPMESRGSLGKWSMPGAVGAAIVASACCWLPLLLLAFGLSAGGVAGFFEAVRPFFLAAAVLFLGAGFYFVYIRKAKCAPGETCATPNLKVQKFNRSMLWITTVLVAGFALFPYYSPVLIRATAGGGPVDLSPTRTEASQPAVTETYLFNVEGMTCAGCAALLEIQLTKLPGVSRAEVSYPDATALLYVAESDLDANAVAAAAKRAGFTAIPATAPQDATPPE
jgi:mercuric ion transport protein